MPKGKSYAFQDNPTDNPEPMATGQLYAVRPTCTELVSGAAAKFVSSDWSTEIETHPRVSTKNVKSVTYKVQSIDHVVDDKSGFSTADFSIGDFSTADLSIGTWSDKETHVYHGLIYKEDQGYAYVMHGDLHFKFPISDMNKRGNRIRTEVTFNLE